MREKGERVENESGRAGEDKKKKKLKQLFSARFFSILAHCPRWRGYPQKFT